MPVPVLNNYNIQRIREWMAYKIQSAMLNKHPQLQQKHTILPYYVSLEFPQKQKKLIQWWASMIECAIRESQQLYLSPSELEVVFTLHGLKPLPLCPVLAILARGGTFQWRDQLPEHQLPASTHQHSVRQALASFLHSMLPSRSTSTLTTYSTLRDSQSKFLCIPYLAQQLQVAKTKIKEELGLNTAISYDTILAKLHQQTPLSRHGLEYLLSQLGNKMWVLMVEVGGNRVILYSEELRDYTDRNWVEIQRVKYNIGCKNRVMSCLIDQKLAEQANLKETAKSLLQKDQKKAKQILQKLLNTQKMRETLETRHKICEDKLHELQLNEANGKTIELLGDAQNILKFTAVDPSALDNIMDQNAEIQLQQKQINSKFEEIQEKGDQDVEDEVDLMLRELEADVGRARRNARSQVPGQIKKAEQALLQNMLN